MRSTMQLIGGRQTALHSCLDRTDTDYLKAGCPPSEGVQTLFTFHLMSFTGVTSWGQKEGDGGGREEGPTGDSLLENKRDREGLWIAGRRGSRRRERCS